MAMTFLKNINNMVENCWNFKSFHRGNILSLVAYLKILANFKVLKSHHILFLTSLSKYDENLPPKK